MSETHVIESVAMSSLHKDPKNVRLHGNRNIDAIKQSLTKFGQTKPIVVLKESGRIIAGNGTYEAAEEIGWTEISCIFVDMTDEEGTAYAIADNRTAEIAQWDSEKLPLLLEEIANYDDKELIASIGYTDAELKRILLDEDDFDCSAQMSDDVIYRIMVTVSDSDEQATLFEQLEKEGYSCQLMMS